MSKSTRLVKDKQVIETTNAAEVHRLKAAGFAVEAAKKAPAQKPAESHKPTK